MRFGVLVILLAGSAAIGIGTSYFIQDLDLSAIMCLSLSILWGTGVARFERRFLK